MNRLRLRVPLAALLLLLQACASMDREECLAADWRTIGFEDGSSGKALQTIASHRKACAEYGVRPDLAAYEAGHRKGLHHYCTVANGFALGASGKPYRQVCDPIAGGDFLVGWNTGRARHAMQQQLQAVSRDLDALREQFRAVHAEIETREAAIVSTESTSKQRRQHLEALDSLREQSALLGEDIRAQEALLIDQREQLDALVAAQQADGFP